MPGFGDPAARVWLIGLAPGAHGANRTGRNFTGDPSGSFLYAALHRAGYCNQPTSVARDDGLVLRDLWISAALRCAPPANRPTPRQLQNCSRWLDADWERLPRVRVILALGSIGFDAALALCARHGLAVPTPRPRFAHGRTLDLGARRVIACYHVSPHNTYTGRLTPGMFAAILETARKGTGPRVADSR